MTGYIVRREKGKKLLKKHDQLDAHHGECGEKPSFISYMSVLNS